MTDNAQPNDGWIIDANAKMKDFREFRKASKVYSETEDETVMYPSLAKLVKAWPHSLDPAVPDNYDELNVLQFREVVKRVTDAFQQLTGSAQ